VTVTVAARGVRAAALAAALRRSARRLLAGLTLDDAELSVVLVSDAEMQRLNRAWRARDRATDVLSFAQAEGAGGAPAGLLGDVVISLDTARRQARRGGRPLAREAERLLVHGLLHLLGYDHERSARDAAVMRRRERELAAWLR
jgi:probable rRNA maturation factor